MMFRNQMGMYKVHQYGSQNHAVKPCQSPPPSYNYSIIQGSQKNSIDRVASTPDPFFGTESSITNNAKV